VKVHADQFAHHKPVFDGRKNLYSRKLLPIGKDRVWGTVCLCVCRCVCVCVCVFVTWFIKV